MTSGHADELPKPGPARRRSGLQLAAAVLVIGLATILVRIAPLFDASVGELWGRLHVIRDQAATARENPDQWRSFSVQAKAELKQIADDARIAHDRRQGPWSWIVGSDRREELALKEAQRLAESELPAILASGSKGSALRQRSVDEAFARLDDHLAGASPYLPPLRPIENQEGMDRKTGVKESWPHWLVTAVVVDTVVMLIALAWWLRRSRRTPARTAV